MISSTISDAYKEIQFSHFQTSPLKTFIGNFFIRHLFFPLANSSPPSLANRLKAKETEVQNFWTGSTENTEFPAAPQIKEHFTHRQEHISMSVNGNDIIVSVEIIESKDNQSENFYQLALGLPNKATIKTYIEGIYPFLEGYVSKKQKNPNILPARFFLISAYDTSLSSQKTPHNPSSLDESGLIFSNTLKRLASSYGKIHLLIAHSVSSFRLAAAAKYGIDIDTICVDRGASSVEELSKIYLLGQLNLMPVGKLCGWDLDVGKEIQTHLLSKPNTQIVVSSVARDHFFPGAANLSNHFEIREAAGHSILPPKMQTNLIKIIALTLGIFGIIHNQPYAVATACCITIFDKTTSKKASKVEPLAKIVLLHFDFPHIEEHKKHHIMPLHNFRFQDLLNEYKNQDLLLPGKTLPEALLDLSYPQS